jgi:hypothetical protein
MSNYDMVVNYNDLMIPIDFHAIAREHGVRKGNIGYSDLFKSWVLEGHPDIDLICIDAPYKDGDIGENLKGKASRFNGRYVNKVTIVSNMWNINFKK